MLVNEINKESKWNNILLIKPKFKTFGWDFFISKFPPLSLLYLASYLDDLNIQIEIIDNISKKKIKKKIKEFKPDIVGISAYLSAVIDSCYNIAKIVKEIIYNCKVVIGGSHATFDADNILLNENVDYVVRGEGEISFRELILKGSPEGIKGISYKSNGDITHNPDRPLMNKKEYTNIKLPNRQLIKNNKFEAIQTSRGCPNNCSFCIIPSVYHQRWRARSIESILGELKDISKRNKKVQDIFFIDDNLCVIPKRIERLCERIIESKKKGEINDFKFIVQLHVKDIINNPSMVESMGNAGVWVAFIGIESVKNEILTRMRKGITFQQTLLAISILHDNNIIVSGLLILGADLNQTISDVLKEIKIIKKLDIDIVNHVILTPFLGSASFRDLDSKGLIISKDWRKYTVFYPVIRTYKLTQTHLYYLLCLSFKELLFRINRNTYKRILKSRGILYMLNPFKLLSLVNSLLKIKIILNPSKLEKLTKCV